ncbi:hypothetical protein KAZ82_01190, partial [Candidatus Babeliales bacterium]|nr:hypothetical protein [Candidatus Babeliales bacterium]
MKNKIIFFLLLSSKIFASVTTLNDHDPVSTLSVVPVPVDNITDSFTKNIFTMIDQTFGLIGIGMPKDKIQEIKSAYLYLIFLAKLEKIKTNAAYKIYQADFEKFLSDNQTAMPHIPDIALVNSAGWASVVLTVQDLQNSTAWQLYSKTMVTDIYVYYSMVLEIIHNVEKQTFNYMSHFETSFYDADYTKLRTLDEMSRTRLILEDHIKQKFLNQIVDWANLSSVSVAQSKNMQTLESEIVQFRASQFYKMIRNPGVMFAIPATQKGAVANTQLISAKKLVSPIKEYIWCYYLLYQAAGHITSFINQQNLDIVLQKCAQSKLMPNIFPYQLNDYVLLDELLSAKSKIEDTHTQSIHPSPQQYHIDQIRKPEHLQQTYRDWNAQVHDDLQKINNAQVQAQMWGFLSDLSHDFSTAFDDVKSGVEAGFDAVKNLGIAVGIGIAGIGAELVGQTSWAHEEFSKEGAAFTKSVSDLNQCLDDFSNAIKDGVVAPMAELTGDLAEFILQDQKVGQDINQVIDQVSDAIVDGADDLTKVLADQAVGAVQYVMQVSQISSELAVQIGTAAWAIFSKQGEEEFLKQGEALGKQCLIAITQAYTVVKNYTVDFVKSVLKSLSVITNAITTIFIDLVREITYLFTGGIFNMLHLSSIPGLQQATAYAKEQANSVTSTLQAHRAVINQVIGVVGCIAADAVIDTATGGAATAADAEIDAAIEGAVEDADVAGQGVAEQVAEKSVGQSIKDFGSKVVEKISTKVQATIEQTKRFAADFAKSAANLLKNSKEIADLAAKEVAEKEAAFADAQVELTNLGDDATVQAKQAAQDAVDKAKADWTEAKQAETEAKEILNESKLGKVKRLSKAAIAKLGTVLKPIGLFMNITFNMGNVVSGYNQDAKNQLDVQTQSQALQKLWSFNNVSQISQATQQLAFLEEMDEKVKAQIGNQALQATLSQNIVNKQVLELRSGLAAFLAQIYVQLLIPDATTGLQMANIATPWNLKSFYLDLYPSQGFFSTTLGRSDFPFAQEIAQAPEITNLVTGAKGGT